MEYRTGFKRWRGADGGFSDWAMDHGPDASALSPPVETDFPFAECVPSWNADTPEGSWLEVFLRARQEEGWTRWYELGVWASGDGAVKRHSVKGQKDDAGDVATDTLRLAFPATAVQARVRLRSRPGSPLPSLRSFSLAWSTSRPATFDPPDARPSRLWGQQVVGVPPRSQMVYPGGGDSWCSPVSVSMVLGYWKGGSCSAEADVRAAAAGVYDEVYGGCGNWSFNAAYAGGPGMEAYVARFSGLRDLELWIAAKVPVVLSVSWNNREGRPLSGAPLEKSAGHLTVLVGFDEKGNPVMNEPAAASDAEVRRTYDRAELEARWLEASGGAAYLIFPEGRSVPAFPG